MNSTNKIDNLNEVIAVSWLEDLVSSPVDTIVLSSPIPVIIEMTAEKKERMIGQLFENVKQLSFGEILTKSLANNKLEISEASAKTGLTEHILKELQEDKIPVNNVPVFIFKNLLQQLNIGFKEAQLAIWRSFEFIKYNTSITDSQLNIRPAFRKGVTDENYNFKRTPNRDLFENEESLKKYLDKLEKLM